MPTKRMKKEDRINQILDVTLGLIQSTPIAGIRTLQIAKTAGISEGALFKYFTTKEEIFERIIQRYMDSTHPLIPKEEINSKEAFRDFIETYITSMTHVCPERIAHLRLLLQISINKHPLAKRKYNQVMDGFWDIMEDRIEYGKIHWSFDKNFDTRIQVRLFHLSILMFLIEQEVFEARETDPYDLQDVIRIAVDNLFKLLENTDG